MSRIKKIRNRFLSLAMAVLIFILPLDFSTMAYEPDGGIYNPGKSKDILVNIDDEILAGLTEEEFIKKLKDELARQGMDIDKVNISLLRTELDATNTVDWYVYDHTNGASSAANWVPPTSNAWWTSRGKAWEGPAAAPVNTDKAFYTKYYDSYANSNSTASGDFVKLYGLPSSGRYNATIKSVLDIYGLNGLRLVWGLREHIYAYSTPVPGKDGKYANMIFAGYGTGDFSDYMYYPIVDDSVGSIEFDIDSAFVNDHSLRGAGFLINTGLSGSYQKGYMLYFDFRDQSNAPEQSNKVAIVKLYKLKDNVTPEALQSNTGNSKVANLFTQVGDAFLDFPTGAQSHWRIVFSNDKITVTANNLGSDVKTEKTWDNLSQTGYYGFGPIVNYSSVGHTCARGTVFQFTNVLMATKYTDEFLNLKDQSFNTGTDVERYLVNLTNREIDEASYIDTDTYWDTVNRLKSDEVFYLTNEENSILTDGGIKDPGDHLQNGGTFTGLPIDELIVELAKYIYNDDEERAFMQNDNPSGGGKPTAVFTLNGKEGTSSPSALQAIEVQRVNPDKPVEITAFDTSVPGSTGVPITKWVYVIKDPEGNIVDTKEYTRKPEDSDILLEIGPNSPTGKYKIELVVTDANGVSSEKVTRTFEAKKDEVPPTASLGPETLPTNTKGEYEQTPHTIELSDEGWGVIAYTVEYLQHGTDTALTGVKTVGGDDYHADENLLNDRAMTLSVPNNVSGVPSIYDIKVTVYDWAGNKTEEIFTVNTLKAEANKAIADLSGYLTATDLKLNDPGLENIADLITEAERIVSEYTNNGGSTGSLTNYSHISDAQDAVEAYNEALAFADVYDDITGISIGSVLTDEDIKHILDAVDEYGDLSNEAKTVLIDLDAALDALGTKVEHIMNVVKAISDLSDCADPDYVSELTITDALLLLNAAEALILAYPNEHPEYQQADLETLAEYALYNSAKEVIDAYLEAQDYLAEHSDIVNVTLSDIPSGLTAMTLEELIAALEYALGGSCDALGDIAKDYYLQEYLIYFEALYEKATTYIEMSDSIQALKDVATDPYEILLEIVDDPVEMERLFDAASTAIASYAGTAESDLSDYDIYEDYREAFDKYADYLEYLSNYQEALSIEYNKVKITDIASIENAIFAYESLADADMKNLLTPQADSLNLLLVKAQDLLLDYNSLKAEIGTLLDNIDPYQDASAINNQNMGFITAEMEAILLKLEEFVELGGDTNDIDNYDTFMNVLNAMTQYSRQSHGGNALTGFSSQLPFSNNNGNQDSSDQGDINTGNTNSSEQGSNDAVNSETGSTGQDSSSPSDNTNDQQNTDPLTSEIALETEQASEQATINDEPEDTGSQNSLPDKEYILPGKEIALSIVSDAENTQNRVHTENMGEGQFAILFDESIYIIYDENANPLGYIIVQHGKTLEDVIFEKSLVPYEMITQIKENPATGDKSNVLAHIFIMFLTPVLYITFTARKHVKNRR